MAQKQHRKNRNHENVHGQLWLHECAIIKVKLWETIHESCALHHAIVTRIVIRDCVRGKYYVIFDPWSLTATSLTIRYATPSVEGKEDVSDDNIPVSGLWSLIFRLLNFGVYSIMQVGAQIAYFDLYFPSMNIDFWSLISQDGWDSIFPPQLDWAILHPWVDPIRTEFNQVVQGAR